MAKIAGIIVTDELKLQIYTAMQRYLDPNICETECLFWQGETDKDGYARLRKSICGKRKWISVHRFMFYFHSGISPYDTEFHVSHLCHNVSCVRFKHLSLEPPSVNAQRIFCTQSKNCTGHGNYPNCIIWTHSIYIHNLSPTRRIYCRQFIADYITFKGL